MPAGVAGRQPKTERMKRNGKRIWACILLTLLCFAVGGISSLLQGAALADWYPQLAKSSLTPPAMAFPVAWSLLYLCMGISGGVIATSESSIRRPAMRLWAAQLAFNFGWSLLFFTFENPLLGLLDILALDLLVGLYVVRTLRHRQRLAGWLFVPYLIWILFASYLNLYVLAANGTGF